MQIKIVHSNFKCTFGAWSLFIIQKILPECPLGTFKFKAITSSHSGKIELTTTSHSTAGHIFLNPRKNVFIIIYSLATTTKMEMWAGEKAFPLIPLRKSSTLISTFSFKVYVVSSLGRFFSLSLASITAQGLCIKSKTLWSLC